MDLDSLDPGTTKILVGIPYCFLPSAYLPFFFFKILKVIFFYTERQCLTENYRDLLFAASLSKWLQRLVEPG